MLSCLDLIQDSIFETIVLENENFNIEVKP